MDSYGAIDLEGAGARVMQQVNRPSVAVGLFLVLALNIAMLTIGIIKKDECPIDHKIPLYLIVAGAAGIASKILTYTNRRLEWNLINFTAYIVYLFEFVWSIVGSVWVYNIYKPHFEPTPDNNYCSESAYLMSFCLLTIQWASLALIIVVSCFRGCCNAAANE